MSQSATVTKDEVLEALRDVYDPEIPVNIVDLGLVYEVDVDDGDVDVQMTLTFAGCGMDRTLRNKQSGVWQSLKESKT